jgi:hypothetical protein
MDVERIIDKIEQLQGSKRARSLKGSDVVRVCKCLVNGALWHS